MRFAELIAERYVRARGMSRTGALREIHNDTGISVGSLRAAADGTRIITRNAVKLVEWASTRHRLHLDLAALCAAPMRTKVSAPPAQEFAVASLAPLPKHVRDRLEPELLLTVAQVAERMGWSTQRTRRWLKKVGAKKRLGIHGRVGHYVVTESLLRKLPQTRPLAEHLLRLHGAAVSAAQHEPLPALTTGQAAEVLKCSTYRARKLLRGAGAERVGRGRFLITAEQLLDDVGS